MPESMARRDGKLLIKQHFGGLKDINILCILISSVMEYIDVFFSVNSQYTNKLDCNLHLIFSSRSRTFAVN
jgi:hypothetical protein